MPLRAMTKACFRSLLQTASNASFLLLPLAGRLWVWLGRRITNPAKRGEAELWGNDEVGMVDRCAAFEAIVTLTVTQDCKSCEAGNEVIT